jgi:alpha-aminoadipate carrier protein LysW
MSATCPECTAAVALEDRPVVSAVIACPECSAELEVVGLDPLVLALAPEVEEDWGE